MVYTIELSFDMRKLPSPSTFWNTLRKLASEYRCDMQYFMNEIEGSRNKIVRNNCIHVVHFPDASYVDFIGFVKDVYKMKCVHIECIYSGDNSYKFIYLSTRYLRRMGKADAKSLREKYRKSGREEKSEVELQILNILH